MGCGSSVVVEPAGFPNQEPVKEKEYKRRSLGKTKARKLNLTFITPTAEDALAFHKHILDVSVPQLQAYCRNQTIRLKVDNVSKHKVKDPAWRGNSSDYFISVLGDDDADAKEVASSDAVKIAHLETDTIVGDDELRHRQRLLNTFYYHHHEGGEVRHRCTYFKDTSELHRSFIADMTKVIASDFPKAIPVNSNLVYVPVRLVHDSYLDSRTVLLSSKYRHLQKEIKDLEIYTNDPNANRVCLVTGTPGSGKSALMGAFSHFVLSGGKNMKKPTLLRRRASTNMLRPSVSTTPTRRPSRAMSRALRDASQRSAKLHSKGARLETTLNSSSPTSSRPVTPDMEFGAGLEAADPSKSKQEKAVLITHACASSSHARRPVAMLRRILRAVKHYANISEYTIPHKPDEVISQFPLWLEEAASRLDAFIVILIDGIDVLDVEAEDGSMTENLDWLPDTLPPGVKIVVSASKAHPSAQRLINVRKCPIIEVPPIFGTVREEVITGIWKELNGGSSGSGSGSGALTSELLERLLPLPCASSPLALETLLREIKRSGSLCSPTEPASLLGSGHFGGLIQTIRRQAAASSQQGLVARKLSRGSSFHEELDSEDDAPAGPGMGLKSRSETNVDGLIGLDVVGSDEHDDSTPTGRSSTVNSINISQENSAFAAERVNVLVNAAKGPYGYQVVLETITDTILHLERKHGGGATGPEGSEDNDGIPNGGYVQNILTCLYASNIGMLEGEIFSMVSAPTSLTRDILRDLHLHGIITGSASQPNVIGSPHVSRLNPNSARSRTLASGKLSLSADHPTTPGRQMAMSLLINIAGEPARTVVERRYLEDIGRSMMKETHANLARMYQKKDPLDPHVLDELPYHLARADEAGGLRRYMSSLNVYQEFVTEARVFEFYIYWNVVSQEQHKDNVMSLDLSGGMNAPALDRETGEVTDLDPKDRLQLRRPPHLRMHRRSPSPSPALRSPAGRSPGRSPGSGLMVSVAHDHHLQDHVPSPLSKSTPGQHYNDSSDDDTDTHASGLVEFDVDKDEL